MKWAGDRHVTGSGGAKLKPKPRPHSLHPRPSYHAFHIWAYIRLAKCGHRITLYRIIFTTLEVDTRTYQFVGIGGAF